MNAFSIPEWYTCGMRFTFPTLNTPGVSRYLIGTVVVLVVGGYFVIQNGSGAGDTFVVTQGDFSQEVRVSGAVIAAQDADLGFATNGRISGTYAKVGERVYAGAVLAEIENGDLVAELSRKRSALVEAEANLSALRSGTRSEELAIASASVTNARLALMDAIRAAYTASDDAVHNTTDIFFTNPRTDPKLTFNISNATLKNAVERERASIETILLLWKRSLETLTEANVNTVATQSQTSVVQVVTFLADANAILNQSIADAVITTSTLTSYGVALASARAAVNAAATSLTTGFSTLNTAEKNLSLKKAGSTSEAVAAQEAVVASSVADVESARAALAKTRVTAPFGGIVTRMDAKVGEIVSPTESLISLQSAGRFNIETYVSEVSIARVAVGNRATTTFDAYSASMTFPAVVIAVDPAETMKDGVPAYKTTLGFLTDDPAIRSGMTVNVVIETGMLRNAIIIPAGAVGTMGGAQYVSVVMGDSTVNKTVTIGRSPALGQAEILSGLSAGDTILLSPVP